MSASPPLFVRIPLRYERGRLLTALQTLREGRQSVPALAFELHHRAQTKAGDEAWFLTKMSLLLPATVRELRLLGSQSSVGLK